MNRDDIIRMAREAGLEDGWSGWCQECGCDSEKLTRFAALVAAAERDAILQMSNEQWFKTQADFETAIRARGQA